MDPAADTLADALWKLTTEFNSDLWRPPSQDERSWPATPPARKFSSPLATTTPPSSSSAGNGRRRPIRSAGTDDDSAQLYLDSTVVLLSASNTTNSPRVYSAGPSEDPFVSAPSTFAPSPLTTCDQAKFKPRTNSGGGRQAMSQLQRSEVGPVLSDSTTGHSSRTTYCREPFERREAFDRRDPFEHREPFALDQRGALDRRDATTFGRNSGFGNAWDLLGEAPVASSYSAGDRYGDSDSLSPLCTSPAVLTQSSFLPPRRKCTDIPPTESFLVSVAPADYQLDEKDVWQVFALLADVHAVKVLGPHQNCALVTVTQGQAAAVAALLDGHSLNGNAQESLSVTLLNDANQLESPAPAGASRTHASEERKASRHGQETPHVKAKTKSTAMANRVVSPSRGGKQTDSAAARSRRGAEPIRKWTVRYEIQIPANNDFQITRRIIGVRGNNMKSVNQATGAKLRLRGRGSGYLEGLGKEEANEPLHLCISCTDEAGYRNARQRTELLLKTVYDEFDQWCLERGIKPPRLAIKAKELLCMHSPV